MSSPLPVSLLLEDRLCVVVGAGAVAKRKVLSLLEAGARVRVVAPRIDPALPEHERLQLLKEPYDPAHLADAFLVIAATDDPDLNRRVACDARRLRAIVNVVDSPADCDFIAPAVVTRGPLQIAIQTGGASPAFARELRKKIDAILPNDVGDFLTVVADLRTRLLASLPDPDRRRAILDFLGSDHALALFQTEGPQALEARVNLLRGVRS